MLFVLLLVFVVGFVAGFVAGFVVGLVVVGVVGFDVVIFVVLCYILYINDLIYMLYYFHCANGMCMGILYNNFTLWTIEI